MILAVFMVDFYPSFYVLYVEFVTNSNYMYYFLYFLKKLVELKY